MVNIMPTKKTKKPRTERAPSSRGPGIWSGQLSAFGEFLKTHQLTRDAVAEGLGVTASYISMVAHGKATPGFRLAKRIADWTKANAPVAFELNEWA